MTKRSLKSGNTNVPVTDQLDEVLVLFSESANYPKDVLNKVEAFLQVRFPELRCTLDARLTDGEQDFVAMPKNAADLGTREFALSFAVFAQLSEITDALEKFKTDGWRRPMN